MKDLQSEIQEQKQLLKEVGTIVVNITGGEVIVLGPVGNNFGAGMTGGFAYVYDQDRSFVDKCNKDLVSFNRITSQEMEAHRSYLKDRIAHFVKETNSQIGKKFLKILKNIKAFFG